MPDKVSKMSFASLCSSYILASTHNKANEPINSNSIKV